VTAAPPSSPLRDHGRALALAALGLGIRIGVLGAPAFHDDHAQLAMLRGTFPLRRAAWDLFAFVRPGEAPALRADGLLPWWTDDRFALAMFRPLSSLALAAELTLGGHRLALVTSALLFAALVVVAGDAFRRTLARPAAWVATLLLALTPAATIPLLWAANQNALLSVLLGLAAVAALVRGRPLAAHAALLLAALAGEYALPMLGYAVAFALTRPRPACTAATLAVAALAPLLLGRALHYGSAASQYADPLRDPALWLALAPPRALALLGAALLGQSAGPDHLGAVFPAGGGATVVGAGLVLAAFAAVVRADPARRAPALAWPAGAALALLPVLSAPAHPRLLLPAAAGFAALLGVVCAVPRDRIAAAPWRLALALPLLLTHAALAPFNVHRDLAPQLAGLTRSRTAALGAAREVSAASRCDVLFDALDLEALHYPPMVWREAGAHPSGCWRVLTAAAAPFTVARLSPRSLLLRSEGSLVVPVALAAYRTAPLRVGASLVTPSMTLTVLAAREGLPTALRVDLSDDLDAYAWWGLLGGRMVRVTMSRMPAELRVPPPL
jgi:hypothetical protein